MAVIAKRSTSWFLIILSLSAAVLVFLPAPKTDAMAMTGFEAYYYTDGTYTVQVGYRRMDCDGYNERWGVTTAYAYVLWDTRCGGSGATYYCPLGTDDICFG